MAKVKIGDKYGRLVVVCQVEALSKGNPRWLCKCDCGLEKAVQAGALKAGKQLSCGCLRLEIITKHGKEGSKAYLCWGAMKQRCRNQKSPAYKAYGGRGIDFCDDWLSFENFIRDMGEPEHGMSLDRIDNNLGYFKENCRWASMKQQNNNRRNNHMLTYKGETKSLTLWAEEFGISPISLKSRIKMGWDTSRSLETPIDKSKATRKKKEF